MPEPAAQLAPPATNGHTEDKADGLRLLSRSPHPYHRQNFELLHPSEAPAAPGRRLVNGRDQFLLPSVYEPPAKESAPNSDSGTEADDEHFLKGFPAPKARLHKGLRGKNEALSGTSTPLLSPALLEEESRTMPPVLARDAFEGDKRANAEKSRRRKETFRRTTELLILTSLAAILLSNPDVNRLVRLWRKGTVVLPL